MTDPSYRAPQAVVTEAADDDGAMRLRDIASELTAIGLLAQLRGSGGLLDLTARIRRGGRDPFAIIDPDGYVELRFWTGSAVPAAQVADIINRALTLVTVAK